MTTTLTPGQLRTAKATAARKRIKYERMAAELRAAGIVVIFPDDPPAEPTK